jgi:hypothetical protein
VSPSRHPPRRVAIGYDAPKGAPMTDTKPIERRAISIKDTQHVLGDISRRSVLRAIERGDLDSVVLGGRRLITVESIDRLLDHAAG